jgi:tetratricopeptide (TPR) repeat protein
MFFSGKNFTEQCLLRNLEEQGHMFNAAGFSYMNMGLPLKAISLFDKASITYENTNLQTDKGQVCRNLAEAMIRVGRLDNAVKVAKDAIKLDPSSRWQESSLAYLGYAYALLGHYDLAEKTFEKALSLTDQEYLPPIRGIQFVELLIMMGKYDEAVDKTSKMLDWIKKQNNILYNEAECLRVLSVALFEIACLNKDEQKAQEAVNLIKRSVDLATQAGVHFYIIRTHLNYIRINLVLAHQKLIRINHANLEKINKQILEVKRVSKESNYALIQSEALFMGTYRYLLIKKIMLAQNELRQSILLAQKLKFKWLENKCYDLEKFINPI